MAALRKSAEPGVDVPNEEASALNEPSLWSRLNSADAIQMKRMAAVIDQTAPAPGDVVYMMARSLFRSRGELRPVLFSAFDVHTHLQIAQLYLTSTTASAIDFLQFTRESLPFHIVHLRTPSEPPFVSPANSSSSMELSRVAGRHGIVHTCIENVTQEPLFLALSRLTFEWFIIGPLSHSSERELVRDLVNFLFFHNNLRSLPSLAGMTPLQKLKTLGKYQHLQSFDPFASLTGLR